MVNDVSSSSAFVDAETYSAEWTDVKLLQRRSHNVIYLASRYGRRFLLKGLTPEAAQLTDFRLAQEKEFRLGLSLSHPHIAATYSLEEIEGIGRCIVQEYIDGVPLAQWLVTKPSRQARERILDQLLDALDYLHQRQLVHHDIKSGNILITHHSANLKLIDFGLSDTDDSLSPLENTPQADMKAVGELMATLFPRRYVGLANKCRQGKYANITGLRNAMRTRRRLGQLMPTLIGAIMLVAASALFVVTKMEQRAEQQRYEKMLTLIDSYIEQEREEMLTIVNRRETYDQKNLTDMAEYTACFKDITDCQHRYALLRDSLTATYAENDPLREQFWQIWVKRESDMNNEFLPLLSSKLQ